jgi:pimeloyl-ACP methyl ester carboxylesterase
MWCGQDSNWGKGMEGSGSELRIEREDGAVLAASLTPPAHRPGPALVAVHGAEAGLRSYPLNEHLHAVLPSAGFAAVTFDRRGEGESTGEPSAGMFDLLADDAIAVVEHVARLEEIDATRIGLWGISQGGWVAPLAATRSERVAFLVLVASIGVSPAEQMREAIPGQLRRAGYGADAVALERAARAELEDVMHGRGQPKRAQALLDEARQQPWWPLAYLPDHVLDGEERLGWIEEMDLEPEPVFAELRVPTLLFYGEEDTWIPIDASIEAWRRARGDEVEVVRLPGTGHDATFASGEISPLYTETLVAWLRARS